MPMTNFEFSERKINGKWVRLPAFPNQDDPYYSDEPDDRSSHSELIRMLLKTNGISPTP